MRYLLRVIITLRVIETTAVNKTTQRENVGGEGNSNSKRRAMEEKAKKKSIKIQFER